VPETFQAVAVIGFALLPGATFIWATERIIGAWGAKAVDRLLRFVALSIGLQVVLAPFTYQLWNDYIRGGKLAQGQGFTWLLYAGGCVYVLAPYLVGTLVGYALKAEAGWARWLFGVQGRPPRAWDYAWNTQRAGYVRILVKTQPTPIWIAGLLGKDSTGRLPSPVPLSRKERRDRRHRALRASFGRSQRLASRARRLRRGLRRIVANARLRWVLDRLKRGLGLANEFERVSYVAPYPEDQDIYLVRKVRIDPLTGTLQRPAPDQPPYLEDGSILIRWDEILLLEIFDK
jgi:Family of unknown function (DUF6338)